jgi:hypothetical protein
MAKQYDKILGLIFIAIGLLGFVPGLVVNSHLFGIFMVSTVHNMVHLLSGLVLLAVGVRASEPAARKTALAFGVIYGLVTLWGFLFPNQQVLGMFHVNMADNILHLLIAVSAILVGLARERRIPV